GLVRGRTGYAANSVLARGCLSALAARGLLLRGRAALLGARARRRGVGLLAAAARRAGRVRDLRRALLRHPLFLQLLVLLLVLDAPTFVWHLTPSSTGYPPRSPERARETASASSLVRVTLVRLTRLGDASGRVPAQSQA